MARALMTIAAEGGKADIAKPMKGLGSGIFEIVLPYRSMPTVWPTPCRLMMLFGLSMPSRRNRPRA